MEHPAVAAARELADGLLRPQAEVVDQHGVPRGHIDALGRAGLMNVPDIPPPVMRWVTEQLAAADASTWFVWTQHHTPVRTLLRSANGDLRDRWLPRLTSGDALAGVAFTHLRRPGPPALTARRDGDRWLLDGEIAWLTSWQLADVFLVGAQCGDDVVWVLVPLGGRPEAVAKSLGLAAMSGTSTVRLQLDRLPVDAADVVLVEPLTVWQKADAAKTADVSPAVFGVAAEAVRRLRERDDTAAGVLADAVDDRLHALRETAYRLIDEAEPGERVEQRLRVRAAAHELACRATTGLVAAGAGRAMLLDAAPQRLARVALFLLVQGQTPAVREATLRALAGQDRPPSAHNPSAAP